MSPDHLTPIKRDYRQDVKNETKKEINEQDPVKAEHFKRIMRRENPNRPNKEEEEFAGIAEKETEAPSLFDLSKQNTKEKLSKNKPTANSNIDQRDTDSFLASNEKTSLRTSNESTSDLFKDFNEQKDYNPNSLASKTDFRESNSATTASYTSSSSVKDSSYKANLDDNASRNSFSSTTEINKANTNAEIASSNNKFDPVANANNTANANNKLESTNSNNAMRYQREDLVKERNRFDPNNPSVSNINTVYANENSSARTKNKTDFAATNNQNSLESENTVGNEEDFFQSTSLTVEEQNQLIAQNGQPPMATAGSNQLNPNANVNNENRSSFIQQRQAMVESAFFETDATVESSSLDPTAKTSTNKQASHEFQERADLISVNPQLQMNTFENQNAVGMANKGSQSSPVKDLAAQIIDHVQVLRTKGQTDTTVQINHPSILKGSELKITEFDHANKEYNITFSNLTNEAKAFLDNKLNGNALNEELRGKGMVVHIIVTTTADENILRNYTNRRDNSDSRNDQFNENGEEEQEKENN